MYIFFFKDKCVFLRRDSLIFIFSISISKGKGIVFGLINFLHAVICSCYSIHTKRRYIKCTVHTEEKDTTLFLHHKD